MYSQVLEVYMLPLRFLKPCLFEEMCVQFDNHTGISFPSN